MQSFVPLPVKNCLWLLVWKVWYTSPLKITPSDQTEKSRRQVALKKLGQLWALL